jgi:phenylacetate-CoA ligase
MSTTETEFRDKVFNRYLALLARTERATGPQLQQYQARMVADVVRHAHDNVPFYRDRLACLFDDQGDVDLRRWSEVPIVTRAEAAQHAAEMRAVDLPPVHGPVSETKTTGSTGIPLSIAANELTVIAANAALTRMARWWGADTSRPLASIRYFRKDAAPYPHGRDSTGWSHADPQAPTYDLDLLTPVEQQLEWLSRKQAPYLLTSPSNAAALAYAAGAEDVRAMSLEVIFTIAETLLPRMREVVQERLGVPIAAVYSCEEVGFIATQCPALSYHLVPENARVEILDAHGTPVAPGEVGNVVVTGLYNYAMPFVRYAIGDVAEAAAGSCPCGRGLPIIGQVLGRTRCAFVFEDGKRFWPRVFESRALRQFVPYREFQMVQLDHRRIELRYVPDGSDLAPDASGLDHYVRTNMHPTAEIALLAVDAIPRGPGGKLDPFVSFVSD